MRTIVILILLIAVTSCGNKSVADAPKQSAHAVAGDKPQRITAVIQILSANVSLPSNIEDAFFLEEQAGDGQLGPSDFSSFCFVQIDAEQVSKWKAILSPIQSHPKCSKPLQPTDWWISEHEFKSLELYKPAPVSTRTIGWVGVSTNSGKIYIHTETM